MVFYDLLRKVRISVNYAKLVFLTTVLGVHTLFVLYIIQIYIESLNLPLLSTCFKGYL